MNKKLLSLDLDGTILVEAHKLERELAEILKLLADKGDIILFNTGRTYTYSRCIFEELDFTFYGAFTNGVALVRFPGKEIIYETPFSAHLLPEIRRVFKKHRVDPIFQGGMRNNDITVFEPLEYPSEMLLAIIREEPHRRREVRSITEDNSRDFVSAFGCSTNERGVKELTAELNTIPGLYSVAFLHSYYQDTYWITVGSDAINKGAPVRRISELHKLEKESIYAFGNDRNDIPMLLEAGHPVTVADAAAEVTALAEEIVDTPDEGGVLNYLKALIT